MFPNGGIIGPRATTTSKSGAGVWNVREAVSRMGAEPRQWPTPQDPSFSSVVGLWHFQPDSENIVATGTNLTLFKNRGSGLDLGLSHVTSNTVAGRFDSTTKKFGTHSLKLADNLICQAATSADWGWGTGDFTLEAWMYFTTLTSAPVVIDCRPVSTNGLYSAIYVTALGSLRYYVNSADRITGSNGNVTTGAWHHIAVARTGTSTYAWLNGSQQGSTFSDSTNYNGASPRLFIGATGNNLAELDGYVSDVRITKGVCRYSASFTPPTTRFPDW